MKPQGLHRRQRIALSADFDKAYALGRKHVGRFLVMWAVDGDPSGTRLGVVTGRKVGPAVERNRARRRIREAYRRMRNRLTDGCDVVLVARAPIVGASWPELVEDLERLLQRAGLWK